MNKDNHSIHMKNGLMCKDNWVAIYGNFKQIYDNMNGNKSNQMYWDLSLQDKVALNLPKSFNKKLLKWKWEPNLFLSHLTQGIWWITLINFHYRITFSGSAKIKLFFKNLKF
jgi:hypothetical protein